VVRRLAGLRVLEQDDVARIEAQLDAEAASRTVQPGDVFLMGDNRPIALDSRWDGAGAIGQIPLSSIIGRVVVGSSSNEHPDVVPGPPGSVDGPTPSAR
jgi:type IV secretory pathway protease TraF